MYVPNTVRPNRPNTTLLPKHRINISDIGDFIRLSDRFPTAARSNLFTVVPEYFEYIAPAL